VRGERRRRGEKGEMKEEEAAGVKERRWLVLFSLLKNGYIHSLRLKLQGIF